MARWIAVVVLPHAPDHAAAMFEAVAEFGGDRVILVQSQESYEIGVDELSALRRDQRLRYRPNDDEGPES